MKLTLGQLEAFFWTAQLGSVQLAARKLHLAQPTISLRLRDLEAVFGAPLFERVGRGIRPNDRGLKLQRHAALILAEVDQIHDQTGEPMISGTLRIGFAEGFGMVCLPRVLKDLQKTHPLLRLELAVSPSTGLERELGRQRLDLAFLVDPTGTPGLHLELLGTQPTVWVASPAWNLDEVTPYDLRSLPILCNPPPSAMFRQITGWFATAGIEPARLVMCTSVAIVSHLICEGAAIGVLPEKVVEKHVQRGEVVVLRAEPPVENGRIYAATNAGASSAAIDAVVASTRRVIQTMDYLR